MGILKSLHLVEEVHEDVQLDDTDLEFCESGEDVDAVVSDDVVLDSLISDIYKSNELSDMSKSIFKVEEIMKSLPNEMTTENKRQSVLSILSSFDLVEAEVSADGMQRINILNSAESKITERASNEVENMENQVESLKEQIQQLEKEIASSKEVSKKSVEIIQAEKDRVVGILDFMAGGE